MSDGTNWKFLIIEDKEVFARELLEALPGFVDAPDSAEAEVFDTFKKAIKRIRLTDHVWFCANHCCSTSW